MNSTSATTRNTEKESPALGVISRTSDGDNSASCSSMPYRRRHPNRQTPIRSDRPARQPLTLWHDRCPSRFDHAQTKNWWPASSPPFLPTPLKSDFAVHGRPSTPCQANGEFSPRPRPGRCSIAKHPDERLSAFRRELCLFPSRRHLSNV